VYLRYSDIAGYWNQIEIKSFIVKLADPFRHETNIHIPGIYQSIVCRKIFLSLHQLIREEKYINEIQGF
jgi:hypothetical protein